MRRIRKGALLGTRRADIIQEGGTFVVELFEEGHFIERVLPKDQEVYNLSARHGVARGVADAWVTGEYNFLQE